MWCTCGHNPATCCKVSCTLYHVASHSTSLAQSAHMQLPFSAPEAAVTQHKHNLLQFAYRNRQASSNIFTQQVHKLGHILNTVLSDWSISKCHTQNHNFVHCNAGVKLGLSQ
jgi:hypothetical protein